MNSRLRKLLLPLLKAVKEGRPISFRMRSAASQGLFLIGKGTSKQRGSSARLKRSTEKRKSHAEETAKIREAVFKRNDGRCEACFRPPPNGTKLQLDHWLSGSGRRREQQSVATCWALCWLCHVDRTTNHPCVEHWNDMFKEHCFRRGYSFTPHVVHEPIARKAQ